MDSFLHTDRYLFYLINNHWHNALFDSIMPFIRNSQSWVPLYVFMLLLIMINFKQNQWWWILCFALLPIFTDLVSSGLIKNNIFRLRPCNDDSMEVRFLLGYRPQSSSFTSSHATNHFGLATFFFFTLKEHIGKWVWLFFIWAVAIAYAQIYVGVHYPGDVICGGLIGSLIGYIIAKLYNNKLGLS